MPFVLELNAPYHEARLARYLKVFRVLAYDSPMDPPLAILTFDDKVGKVPGLEETEVRGHDFDSALHS